MVTDQSGQYMFGITHGSSGVILTAEGSMPEPGAGSLLLVALGPGALFLARRRKPRGR